MMSKALILCLLAATATAGEARIDLLGGESHRQATLVSITKDRITFTTEAGETVRADRGDLVGMTFKRKVRKAADPGDADVAVMLRGGDRIHGALLPGGEERVRVTSPLLGQLEFPIDDVKEIRFLAGWVAAADKPVYPTEAGDWDLFYYRSLDKLEGTFLKFTQSQLVVNSPRLGKNYPIDFRNLLSIRPASFEERPPVKGRVAVLTLTDGSRVTAREIGLSEGKLTATTVRGENVSVRLEDLVALVQKGGRFLYLSDVKPKEEKLVPWLGEVYAWDRPRYDASVLDRPLTSGGETYLKGIGVISGTSITYELSGSYQTFTSRIAMDDRAGEEGDVVFEVLLDGKPAFTSKVQRVLGPDGSPERIPPIPLDGAKTLTLRVTYVDDFVRDYANWIEPMLVK